MIAGAALFDVFGTLVDWRRGVVEALAAIFVEYRISADPAALADAWRAAYEPSMAPIREGRRAYVALDVLHRENLDRVLAAEGLAGRLPGSVLDDLARCWERLPAWEDTAPGLAAIRALMPVAPCSNGSIGLMLRLARHAGLGWDAILGAEIARNYKPASEVYRVSCAALRLPPEDVLMVAAHNGDLAAAQAQGLRTAFVPRPLEHGPGGAAELVPEGDWDLVAPDLRTLAGLLWTRVAPTG
ncbi:MAG: haloacid dehalogenase type II [Pikeienuella sp.]